MNDRQWSCLGRMKYIWNLDFCFTWFINALTRCLAQIFGLMAKPWRWVGLHPWTPPAMTDRSNRRIHWLPDEHLLGEPVQIRMILFPSQWILTPFGILMHNLNPHCKIIKMLHNLHQIFTLIASEAQRHGVVTISFLWVTWKDVTKCDPGVSRSVTNCPRVIGPWSLHRASINQTCSETPTYT